MTETPGSEQPSHDDGRVEDLEREVARLRAALEQSTASARQLERQLVRANALRQERERALAEALTAHERLRQRRSVRTAIELSDAVRPTVRRVGHVAKPWLRRANGALGKVGLRRKAPKPVQARDVREVADAIVASLPPAPAGEGRITVIVELRTHHTTLARCLAALADTAWDDLEILVAGVNADHNLRAANGSEQRADDGRQRIRPVNGDTIADARREALSIATGDLVLLLHDDVQPLEPGWLARMASTLREEGCGAVGARLLVPADGADPAAGVAAGTIAHLGLEFAMRAGVPTPVLVGVGGDPNATGLDARVDRPGASGACLLARRSVLQQVGMPTGGMAEGEDPELSLRLRAAGLRIVVDGRAVLWHERALAEARPGRLAEGDVSPLDDSWGPSIHRAILLDRIVGSGAWSSQPIHVGITLTQDDESAGFGDWYTAHELGDALRRMGWTVSYHERMKDRWYNTLGACDVVMSLLPQLDLTRLPRHLITVAWIRNWTEEWTKQPSFQNHDIVLVSSGRSKEVVELQTAKTARVFPIATNPLRFHPRPANPDLASDVVFVGSNWGQGRGVAAALPRIAASGLRLRVYGKGWDTSPDVAALSGGLLAYDEIPPVYASTSLAIDDAAVSTKPYGSVNSRVFDTLAMGTLIVSNNAMGVRELFGDDFPTWEEPEDLERVVADLVADTERRTALATRFRADVLEHHTYDHRAAELRTILAEWVAATRVAVHIGPTDWATAATWGDLPFARDIQRNLERRGHPTTVLVHEERASAAANRADVSVHVFGVRAPRTLASQTSVLWVISHPDRVTESLCTSYDVLFAASDRLCEDLSRRVGRPVLPLHQATEATRFYPDPTGPHHELLFVGNSRGVRRPVIEDLRGTPWDLAVYGGGWTPDVLDPARLRGTWVANDQLRAFYSSADIVLNDHWRDMREAGIISNRVYDALACGAFVVSDMVLGLDEEFAGSVATFGTREELLEVIEQSLANPAARAAAAERGRAAVLANHTFAHRVDRILEVAGPFVDTRRRETGLPLPDVAPQPAPPSRGGA